MKRILFLLLIFVLAFGFTGCGGEDSNNTPGIDPNAGSEQVGSDEPVLTVFEQFEQGLKEEGLEYEKVVMAAEMVGALEGYKYKFESGKAELYRFEKDGEAIKDASENKSLYLEGFGSFPVEVNENLALLIEDDEHGETVLKLFNQIK